MRNNRLLSLISLARRVGPLLATLLLTLAPAHVAFAQSSVGPSQTLITQPVDESSWVVLSGNTRPEAQNPGNGRGPVADSLPLDHMMLQLRRPAAQEHALKTFIDALHNPRSPNFHHWLSASEFGVQFGPANSDIQTITGWLASHGFGVNVVYPNNMTIDFSGTAGQIRTAFQTEIHNLMVDGVAHIANVSDPQIPAALAPAVAGIVSLHNFMPRGFNAPQPEFSSSNNCSSNFQVTSGCHKVTPADLATIYNFNPVVGAGNTGQNQTIYLIEDSDLFANSDWTTFRSIFGLSGYTAASLTTIHPAPASGSNNCSDPGVTSDDGEAILDAEWSSAAAPSAAIVMATCADTPTTSGLLIAIQNLINGPNPPAIMSQSYGQCETLLGAAGNAAHNAIYQQGVAEGTSIFNSGGDQGGAKCDRAATVATHGINVNAFASTPYNVAVGGTDFGDTYAGTTSIYWNSSNTSIFGSAKSYIPEIPWNDTCASQLVASYEGFATAYGSGGFCNSTTGQQLLEPLAGGGGPSGCATGAPSTSGVVSGTCAGYAKPSWQSGVLGNPADGVRDIPDVSLFAAGGPWGHAYGYCFTGNGGSCINASGNPGQFAFGTSAAAPVMAGVQALINQSTGMRWGNPNYVLYQLAGMEYGASGSSICNSSNGNAVGTSCVFHDVTLGDNDTACGGLFPFNCYLPSGTYGVLSTSAGAFAPAFTAQTGWDFATGLGTPNVANLVANWGAVSSPLLAAVLPESRSVQVGGTATAFATIINAGTTGLSGCAIAPANGLPLTFVYQTTDPATNAVTGSPNTPVNIAAGASQSFVIALTPSAAFAPADAAFIFSCANVPQAPVVTGLNTLLLSASTSPTPDIVALAATLQNDGIVHVTGAPTSPNGPPTGVFAVATINLGSADTITASTNTGEATLPITIAICQTNPQTGVCLQTPGPTASTTIAANATPTFGIFVSASGTVPFDPANSRIFVQFTDSTGAVRGETSVAVETQ
jgi:hypothetical protein